MKSLEKNEIKKENNDDELNIDKIQLKHVNNIEAYSINPNNNSFVTFLSSFTDVQYLIFISKNDYIVSYDLNSGQKLAEIYVSKAKELKRLEHLVDKKNKRDLLMIYYFLPNSLTIFDIRNWSTVLFLEKINTKYDLINFACFFYYIKTNECLIISSNDIINYIKLYLFPYKIRYVKNYSRWSSNLIVLNLKGKIKKQIKNSNVNTSYIKTYYNAKNGKTFIIALSNKSIKSYDYENNSLYQIYYNKDVEGYSIIDIIKTKEGVLQLISSSAAYGLILIWNFNKGHLLNQIQLEEKYFSMFFYNERILYIGTMNGNIIIMDILSQVKKKLNNMHGNYINCINKFFHKKEGKCLITQGNDNIIKIYRIISD